MKTWLKHFFIPHTGNNYQPHSLQKAAFVGMLAMVLLSFALTNLQAIIWVASDWMVSTILPAVIVQDTNTERSSGALSSLVRNNALDQAAQMKANDMAKNGYFAHTSPKGVTPWYWFAQAGYNYVHAGENLAVYFTDSGEVVKAWMNSPTHRANIMDGKFSEIGIGVAEGEYEGFPTVFVVQLFGTPAATPTNPRVAGVQVAPEPKVTTTTVADSFRAPTSSVPSSTPDSLVVAPTEATTTEDQVLASNLTLHESIERVPPPAVAVLASSAPSSSSEITDITVSDYGVVAYSDTVSTSTNGVAATVDDSSESESIPLWARFATQPHVVLQIIYALIAGFVFIALALSVVVEVRKQQPLQIFYSIILLALMFGLMSLHLMLTEGAVIL